jgi:catechol 2,3-dioxygenase-like lactoylglutathione lyase family enzyme
MSANRNAPPKTGWAKIVTELHVADLDVSLAFWTDIIGFEIAFCREEEKFVYLEHPEGQQIMLCQRHGRFETGPMLPPLGQGAMFQIYFRDVGLMLAKLVAQNWPIYLGPRQVWRRTGDRESGQQEVFVQDPDGYLLMLAQSIGERVFAQADLISQITDENRHEEIDTGPPSGHEFGSVQTPVQSAAPPERFSGCE